MPSKTILITGATGFIGQALTRALTAQSHQIIALTRNPKKSPLKTPQAELISTLESIPATRRIDAIINLAGEPLAAGLWTASRKQRFVQSRLSTTDAVVTLIHRLNIKPEVLISGSAVGYYGDRGPEPLTEASLPQPIFMSQLCQDWESHALQAAPDVRVCLLRTGFVIGNTGGAAQPLAMATRFGAGAIMGPGTQFISWIHLEDIVRLICFALDRNDLKGPLNATAPAPVTQAEFAKALGRALHRPVFLKIPARFLKLALGEMSDLFLISEKVLPAAATTAGFKFNYNEINQSFENLFRK